MSLALEIFNVYLPQNYLDPGQAGLTGVLVPSHAEEGRMFEYEPVVKGPAAQARIFRLRLVTQKLAEVVFLNSL